MSLHHFIDGQNSDGKTSKLVFGLKPMAATALMTLLSKQLSNDQAHRLPPTATVERKGNNETQSKA